MYFPYENTCKLVRIESKKVYGSNIYMFNHVMKVMFNKFVRLLFIENVLNKHADGKIND